MGHPLQIYRRPAVLLCTLVLALLPWSIRAHVARHFQHRQRFKEIQSVATALVLGGTTALLLPDVAAAIDHPVDHALLGLPLPPLDPRYFVAGGLCAAASHGITVPVDVIKTRIQSDSKLQRSGMISAAAVLVEEEGLGVLLGGLLPTVVGYAIEGSVKFGVYETLKQLTILIVSSTDVAYLLASLVAGSAAAVLLCPMEQLRIKAVINVKGSAVTMSSLFFGLPAMLSKQVFYTLGKQVSFDEFAERFYRVGEASGFTDVDIKYQVSVAAAAAASIVACVLSHPGDVILTSTYQADPPESFGTVVRGLWKRAGWKAFTAGLDARLVHVGVIITSQLVLYDIVKQALGLPATGTH